MIVRDIERFWRAYEGAIEASDYALAELLVKAAVKYIYICGLGSSANTGNGESSPVIAWSVLHSELSAEAEKIISTVRAARRYNGTEFAADSFSKLLMHVYDQALAMATTAGRIN